MKVVMVDDSAADRSLCRVLLEEVYGPDLEFFEESEAAEGLKTCRSVAPDCVLLEYKLPDMTGLEFLAQLHSEIPLNEPAFAVVMLTGLSSEQVAVEAMRSGAQDYLLKHRISGPRLGLAIQRATQKVGLIRELREEHARLTRSLAEKEVLIHEQLYESADLRQVHLAHQANLLMSNLFNAFGVDSARISGQVVVFPRAD